MKGILFEDEFCSMKRLGIFPSLFRIGGGEIRTLVLSKHPTHAYMLIASVN